MGGLLMKEFLYIRMQVKSLLIAIVAVIAFFMIAEQGKSTTSVISFAVAAVAMMFVLLAVNAMAFDEMAKWDSFARSLPVRTSTIVGSKYLLSLMLCVVGLVLGILMALIGGKGNINLETLSAIIAGAGGAPLILCSILLPLSYKFGTQKARIAMMIVFIIPFAAVFFAKASGVTISSAQIMLLLKLSPVILLAFVLLSFLISCKIYQNKEV